MLNSADSFERSVAASGRTLLRAVSYGRVEVNSPGVEPDRDSCATPRMNLL